MTHNYHDFMSGFVRFVDEIIDAPDFATYREHVRDSESTGTWQSLTTGPNYKAGYCRAMCPAGEEPLSTYEADAKDYVRAPAVAGARRARVCDRWKPCRERRQQAQGKGRGSRHYSQYAT